MKYSGRSLPTVSRSESFRRFIALNGNTFIASFIYRLRNFAFSKTFEQYEQFFSFFSFPFNNPRLRNHPLENWHIIFRPTLVLYPKIISIFRVPLRRHFWFPKRIRGSADLISARHFSPNNSFSEKLNDNNSRKWKFSTHLGKKKIFNILFVNLKSEKYRIRQKKAGIKDVGRKIQKWEHLKKKLLL